jgi:hypothetical protein
MKSDEILLCEVGSDEVHRPQKRDAAFADAMSLHGLRRRMVYLEDFQHVGKSRAAKRKAVESRTD